jgi:hypothetical protein
VGSLLVELFLPFSKTLATSPREVRTQNWTLDSREFQVISAMSSRLVQGAVKLRLGIGPSRAKGRAENNLRIREKGAISPSGLAGRRY